MTFGAFLLIVLIVVVLAAVVSWAIKTFGPAEAQVFVKIIWTVAVFIVVVALVHPIFPRVFGDIAIPHL